MKKSSSVTLGLLTAVAMMATTGCNRRTEVRDCIDQNRQIVDERLCQQQDEQRQRGYGGAMPYYWMYGGSSGGRVGDTVVGGSTSPTPGVGAVSRGGFGTSMHGGVSS